MSSPDAAGFGEFSAYPRVLRRHATIWTVLLPGMALFGWFALPQAIRVQFTGFQLATLVFFVVVMLALVWSMAGCWVKAGPGGVRFRNGLRVHRVAWGDIASVRYRPGDAWAFLELGTVDHPLIGLQRVDRGHVDADVATLRELHARYAAAS